MSEKKYLTPHDEFFHYVFSKEENARELILFSLPDEIIQLMDLEKITVSQESFVDDALKSRHSDILIRTAITGEESIVYILVEHKSYPYRWTLLQLLKYMVRIWERELTRKGRGSRQLPPIVPLIFYHGIRRWRFPLDFPAYIRAGSKGIETYIPRFRAELIDLRRTEDRRISGSILFLSALKTFKYIMAGLKKHLGEILEGIAEKALDEERRSFLEALFQYILEGGRIDEESLNRELERAEFKEQKEVYMTIGEKLKKKGIEEGIEKAKQEDLIRQLDKKFSLTEEERDAIKKVKDINKLDAAIDAFVFAETKEEVLKLLR